MSPGGVRGGSSPERGPGIAGGCEALRESRDTDLFPQWPRDPHQVPVAKTSSSGQHQRCQQGSLEQAWRKVCRRKQE
eukprot:15429112-Alexandrium_andersonii.AAC.1